MHFMFDLDGTLLSDGLQITQSNKEWLRKLKSEGHSLSINTGRPIVGVTKNLNEDDLKLFDYISSFNGAHVQIGDHILKKAIPGDFLIQVLSDFSAETHTITASCEDILYTNHLVNCESIVRRLKPSHVLLFDKFTPNQDEIFTIRFIFKNEAECTNNYQIIKKYFGEKYQVVMTTEIFILVSHISVTKNVLVDYIQTHITKEIIFFGDSHNDLAVFCRDDIFKVAPSNAVPEIKELASLVLPQDNNVDLKFDFSSLKF